MGEVSEPYSPMPDVAAFYGAYAHTLDSKGRIIIPNAYRELLGETFTMGPTRDFEGIGLYPESVYDAMLKEVMSLNQRKPIVQKYATQLFKLSYRGVTPDAQGRVLLPIRLRQRMLGESKELEISGAMDYVRIMASDKADSEDAAFINNRDSILEEYGNQQF